MKLDHLFPKNLPILEVLNEIRETLNSANQLVLQAPPGAGKTTVVPLALLNESWLQDQKILMLEPRRIAARNAAERMASLLGEKVGQTVGYRVRFDNKVSEQTRIEVITEGILARMLTDDPSLEDTGVILFDEFHERSLDADLGLSLTLQSRRLFRNPAEGELPLKLVVMSATLDDEKITHLIGDTSDGARMPAPVLKSEGRQYPVKAIYSQAWQPGENIVDRTVKTLLNVIATEQDSVLVFLPGQKEIRLVEKGIRDSITQTDLLLCPLYGDLSLNEQRQAISPAPDGKRKIVLATAIAESSLTIEGVSVVVDAGLSRMAVFDPRTGMTRLHTKRLSRASSIQRMGRAGRMAPGVCYRHWSESQQDQLTPFTPPEILQADLAPLALALINWGVSDPNELDWLDAPPCGQYSQALDLLNQLGAISKTQDEAWAVTAHGQSMAAFPAHPRLAHMLLKGKAYGLAQLASDIAALIGDRDPLGPDAGSDIDLRLHLLNSGSKGHKRLKQQSLQFKRLLDKSTLEQLDIQPVSYAKDPRWVGFLLACAYPDRIASRRKGSDKTGRDYQLSNGRAAQLKTHDSLQDKDWIVVADLGGHQNASKDHVYLASAFDVSLFDNELADLVNSKTVLEWDDKTQRFLAEHQQKVGKLVLSSQTVKNIPPEDKARVLVELVRTKGLKLLPWTDEIQQWRARISLMRQLDETNWPDLSDEYLLEHLEDWLSPYLHEINHINHFAKLDLKNILAALLPWPLPQQLDELAPIKINVPSGSNISIDYTQNPPVLAVRLQEMFGCTQTPSIGHGQIPLMLHLLSPAQRPLAVTQDLVSFWQNAYLDVKKDMKGRYPKHYWPDDPLVAEATSRAKQRS